MLAYYCAGCEFYYRDVELLPGKRCPECREVTKPRAILGGQVMGSTE